MGQELRDLIDTMFWLKASPEQRAIQVLQQEAGRASSAKPEFPEVPGIGFVKIGQDLKWYTDPSVYLTRQMGDSFYFRNALFPNDPTVYLAGDKTFRSFVQDARAAFTSGDGIDIVAGDIRVDGTVSRVGHIHDDRYYTETEMDAKLFTKDVKHRFPINADGTYNVVPSYSNANRQITLTPTGSSFDIWINGIKHTFTGAQVLPQHSNTSGKYFYYLNENGVFQVSTTPFELLKVAPVATVLWNSTKGEARWIHEFHTTEMSPLTHQRLHEKGSVIRTGGFAISGYTLDTTSQSAVNFGVAGGLLFDEDIQHTIPALADGGPYEIWYRTGANGDWTWDSVDAGANAIPYKYGATYFTVNQIVTGSWSQVEINSGEAASYGNIFVVITPNNGGVPIVCVQGQNIYTDLATATAESWDALDKGAFPFMEAFPIYRLTYKASVAYSGTTGRVQLAKITSVSAGGESGVSGATVHNSLSGRDASDAHPALAITDIAALANGSIVKKISTGLAAAGASDLPAHASRHHWDGADPLTGQSIAGLRTTSEPRFAFLYLQAASTITGVGFFNSSAVKMFEQRWDTANDRLAFFSCTDAGAARNNRLLIPRSDSLPVHALLGFKVTGTTTLDTSLNGMLKAAAGVVSVASAEDLPMHASRHHAGGTDQLSGQSISGLLPTSDPTFRNLSVNNLIPFSGIKMHHLKNYFDFLDNSNNVIVQILDSGVVVNLDLDVSGNFSVLGVGATGITKVVNGVMSLATGEDLPSHEHSVNDLNDAGSTGILVLKAETDQDARDVIDSPSNADLWTSRRISVKDPKYLALATPTDWSVAFNAARADAEAIVESFSDSHLNVVTQSIWIPAGIYPFTAPVDMGNCVQWEGAGSGCTELVCNFAGELFRTNIDNEYSNVHVRGIKFRSGRTGIPAVPYGNDCGLSVRGMLRNCVFSDLVFQGFYDSIICERSWTQRFDQCCSYNARHRHINNKRETGIVDIIGGRYDECDDYGIYMDSSEGELIMRSVVVQSGKKSAVKVVECPTVYLDNCFFESNCINSTTDYHIELTTVKTANTSAKVVNCAINDHDDISKRGLGIILVDNYNIFQYEERWSRNGALAVPKVGLGVESVEIQLGTAENTLQCVQQIIGEGKANHAMIRQVARPTRFYGQDMKSDGNFAPEVRGTLGVGGVNTFVAVGLYNGVPAVQGAGSPADLHVNPDRGHVRLGQNGAYIPEGTNQYFGQFRHVVSAALSDITPNPNVSWTQVNCTDGPHQIDLNETNFPTEYGNTKVFGKTDSTTNRLRIVHSGATINGQPYLDLTQPYQQVTLGSSDSGLYIISKFPA